MKSSENYTLLLKTASRLFRQRGYSGVGLNEILAQAGLPKGSLYYHFPGGKPELAAAATRWAGRAIETHIDTRFSAAPGFRQGAAAVCLAIADVIDSADHILACPVMSVLPAATTEPALREAASQVYADWTACLHRHAMRFGVTDPRRAALDLHMRLQGAWVLAYAEESAGPFRFLAENLGHRDFA